MGHQDMGVSVNFADTTGPSAYQVAFRATKAGSKGADL